MKLKALALLAMLMVQFLASVHGQETTYNCRVFDWEADLANNHLAHGAVVANQYAPIFTVTGSGRNEAGIPRIYDSSTPEPTDLDLGTPNNKCGGPGVAQSGTTNNAAPGRPGENCVARSNILILSKPNGVPNDLENGGTLTFSFPQAVRVDNAGILDIETRERAGTIKLYGPGDALLFTGHFQPLGDNTYQDVNLGQTEGVVKIVVDFIGSGGITHFTFCIPEEGFPGCPDDSVCPCDADTRSSSIACLKQPNSPQISHHSSTNQLVVDFLDNDNLNSGNGCFSDGPSD